MLSSIIAAVSLSNLHLVPVVRCDRVRSRYAEIQTLHVSPVEELPERLLDDAFQGDWVPRQPS